MILIYYERYHKNLRKIRNLVGRSKISNNTKLITYFYFTSPEYSRDSFNQRNLKWIIVVVGVVHTTYSCLSGYVTYYVIKCHSSFCHTTYCLWLIVLTYCLLLIVYWTIGLFTCFCSSDLTKKTAVRDMYNNNGCDCEPYC